MQEEHLINWLVGVCSTTLIALCIVMWHFFQKVLSKQDEHSLMLAEHNLQTSTNAERLRGDIGVIKSEMNDISRRIGDLEETVYNKRA